jgi:hypothetical protein
LKVLVDECVPKALLKRLHGQTFKTAQQMGWTSVKNGDLLALAEGNFDLFLTADQNIVYQQNLRGRRIAILVLSTNLWPPLEQHFGVVQAALDRIQSGQFLQVKIPPFR